MSVEAMSWVLNHSRTQGAEKLVLVGIASHADREGRNAWPALETLATYASVSTRTVQRIITRLVTSDQLIVHRNRGGNLDQRGDRRPNLYELVMPDPSTGLDGVTPAVTPSGGGNESDDGVTSTVMPLPLNGVTLAVTPKEGHGVTKQGPRGDKNALRGDMQGGVQTSLESPLESPSTSPDGEVPANAAARAELQRLCDHLADAVTANGSKRPRPGKTWHTAARLLLDVDGRSEQQVHAAIDWCQRDRFWRGVVLSMPKLREKYDQLRLAAERERSGPRGNSGQRISPGDRALQLAGDYPHVDLRDQDTSGELSPYPSIEVS